MGRSRMGKDFQWRMSVMVIALTVFLRQFVNETTRNKTKNSKHLIHTQYPTTTPHPGRTPISHSYTGRRRLKVTESADGRPGDGCRGLDRLLKLHE